MSKFDRCIFISIAVGIWALAMTQIFQPSTAVAIGDRCGSILQPCHVTGDVSAHISGGLVEVTGLVQTY